jgi:large subunit ribosomal protein L28
MGMQCAICQKKPVCGNQYVRRGKAKYLGGIGRKTTGISRRMFKPNLQSVKIVAEDGGVKRVRVCVNCIRTGAVQRPVKRKPFQLPKV